VLRQLVDEGITLGLALDDDERALAELPQLTWGGLAAACGAAPTPATEACYARLIDRHNALLLGRLNAKET
jgi:hypothetical protein